MEILFPPTNQSNHRLQRGRIGNQGLVRDYVIVPKLIRSHDLKPTQQIEHCSKHVNMASFETFESDVSEKQFMEAAVNSLLKEGDEFCDEVEKCFD